MQLRENHHMARLMNAEKGFSQNICAELMLMIPDHMPLAKWGAVTFDAVSSAPLHRMV